jgi:hypothetical protein
MRIVDSTTGIEMARNDKLRTKVFRLLPRHAIIEKSNWDANENYKTLIAYHKEVVDVKGKQKPSVRTSSSGGERQALYEDGSEQWYHTPGAKINRNGRGVTNTKPIDIDPKKWNDLMRMMRRAEDISKTYLEKEMIWGVTEAHKRVNWPKVKLSGDETPAGIDDAARNQLPMMEQGPQIWQQLAVANNVMLNCHKDDDFFVSGVTVLHECDAYTMEDPIVQYFVFPEDGVAVALRAGDILLFNPSIPHCISSRCYYKHDILACSFYLKARLVGGHDNSNKKITIDT